MISRRQFLSTALVVTVPLKWARGAFEGLVKRPQNGYYPHMLARIYGWFNREFFDFSRRFTKKELEYLVAVLKTSQHLRWHDGSDNSLRKVYWGLRLKGKETSFSRFVVGFDPSANDLRKLAQEVILQRGIKDFAGLRSDSICGLGWDFDNEIFKIYFLPKKSELSQYLKDLRGLPPLEKIPESAIASLKFRKMNRVENRLCFAVQKILSLEERQKIFNHDRATQIMGHYSNTRDNVYFPDYMGINYMRLPMSFKNFSEKAMDNFAMGPTMGIINQVDNMSLYFP